MNPGNKQSTKQLNKIMKKTIIYTLLFSLAMVVVVEIWVLYIGYTPESEDYGGFDYSSESEDYVGLTPKQAFALKSIGHLAYEIKSITFSNENTDVAASLAIKDLHPDGIKIDLDQGFVTEEGAVLRVVTALQFILELNQGDPFLDSISEDRIENRIDEINKDLKELKNPNKKASNKKPVLV